MSQNGPYLICPSIRSFKYFLGKIPELSSEGYDAGVKIATGNNSDEPVIVKLKEFIGKDQGLSDKTNMKVDFRRRIGCNEGTKESKPGSKREEKSKPDGRGTQGINLGSSQTYVLDYTSQDMTNEHVIKHLKERLKDTNDKRAGGHILNIILIYDPSLIVDYRLLISFLYDPKLLVKNEMPVLSDIFKGEKEVKLSNNVCAVFLEIKKK